MKLKAKTCTRCGWGSPPANPLVGWVAQGVRATIAGALILVVGYVAFVLVADPDKRNREERIQKAVDAERERTVEMEASFREADEAAERLVRTRAAQRGEDGEAAVRAWREERERERLRRRVEALEAERRN